MNSKTLIAEGLFKSYGAIKAVENISLHVESGKSLCIQGRSGSGKTSLLKMLALISRPDKGNVFINGVNTTESSEGEITRLRRRIGFSFQEPLLLPYLNAIQNLSLVISSVNDRKLPELEFEARELLSRLGLSKRLYHFPSKLSVGEKKRVDFARAVSKHPIVIIADEPFANLDPETSRLVAGLLEDHLNKGGAVVYSSTEPTHSKIADDCLKLSPQPM